jgi:hypothetical protein
MNPTNPIPPLLPPAQTIANGSCYDRMGKALESGESDKPVLESEVC